MLIVPYHSLRIAISESSQPEIACLFLTSLVIVTGVLAVLRTSSILAKPSSVPQSSAWILTSYFAESLTVLSRQAMEPLIITSLPNAPYWRLPFQYSHHSLQATLFEMKRKLFSLWFFHPPNLSNLLPGWAYPWMMLVLSVPYLTSCNKRFSN